MRTFSSLLFVLLGLSLLVASWHLYQHTSETSRWPTTTCVIESSTVQQYLTRVTMYYPAVTYSYTVDGTAYSGNMIRLNQESSARLQDATERAAQYPVGSTVTVHYNPQNPSVAVLDTSFSILLYGFIVFSMVFTALASWASIETLRKRRS